MTSQHPAITVFAGTNIALVKYWAAGSLSLTLADLGSETTVRFDAGEADETGKDTVFLDGSPAPEAFANRVRGFLDLIRDRANLRLPARVRRPGMDGAPVHGSTSSAHRAEGLRRCVGWALNVSRRRQSRATIECRATANVSCRQRPNWQ